MLPVAVECDDKFVALVDGILERGPQRSSVPAILVMMNNCDICAFVEQFASSIVGPIVHS